MIREKQHKKEVETHVAGDKAASEVTPPYADKNAIAHATTPSGSRLEQSGVADRTESAYFCTAHLYLGPPNEAGTEQEQEPRTRCTLGISNIIDRDGLFRGYAWSHV